jgi:hypothetical protein
MIYVGEVLETRTSRIGWLLAQVARLFGGPLPTSRDANMPSVGRALHRPAVMRMPAAMLRLLGDFGQELFLGGQKVLPVAALASGFQFRHETMRSALTAIIRVPNAMTSISPNLRFGRIPTPAAAKPRKA